MRVLVISTLAGRPSRAIADAELERAKDYVVSRPEVENGATVEFELCPVEEAALAAEAYRPDAVVLLYRDVYRIAGAMSRLRANPATAKVPVWTIDEDIRTHMKSVHPPGCTCRNPNAPHPPHWAEQGPAGPTSK